MLSKFNIHKIKNDSTVCVIGRRETGKTCLIKDILFNHRDLQPGCIVNPLEEIKECYSDIVPSSYIRLEFGPKCKYTNFLVLDDCFYDTKQINYVRDVNSILCIVALPYPMNITNSNIKPDFVFVFSEHNENQRNSIYKQYVKDICNYELFKSLLDTYTKDVRDHQCLVIHTKAEKLEDSFFWYKSELHSDFRMNTV